MSIPLTSTTLFIRNRRHSGRPLVRTCQPTNMQLVYFHSILQRIPLDASEGIYMLITSFKLQPI
jgi:hypothetical protein